MALPSSEPAAGDARQQDVQPAREQLERRRLSCTPHAPSCLGVNFWMLSPLEMLKVTLASQCHLLHTRDFPGAPCGGGEGFPTAFSQGMQLLSEDLSKTSSADSAERFCSFLLTKPLWFVLSSPALYRAPTSIHGRMSPCVRMSPRPSPSPLAVASSPREN